MGILDSLRSLFGGAAREAGEDAPAASVEHNGYTIHATPYLEGGQYQTCGVIEKEIGGEKKTHRFVRADRYASREDAVSFTLDKGRQIVNQQGDRVFGS